MHIEEAAAAAAAEAAGAQLPPPGLPLGPFDKPYTAPVSGEKSEGGSLGAL